MPKTKQSSRSLQKRNVKKVRRDLSIGLGGKANVLGMGSGELNFSLQKRAVPAAMTYVGHIGQPKISSAPEGIRVIHSENILDVLGGGSFLVNKIVINPGNSTTFPWLSGLAQCFEKYKINKICFIYLPNVGTATPGAVYGAFDYDPSDDAPSTKRALMAYQGANRTTGYEEMCFNSLSKEYAAKKDLYVKTTQTPSKEDLKFYDMGNFYLASSTELDFPYALLGELYVSYDISLRIPQAPPIPITPPSLSNAWYMQNSTSTDVYDPLDITTSVVWESSIAEPIVAGGNNYTYIHFLIEGTYWVEVEYTGTGIANSEDPQIKFVGLASDNTIELDSPPDNYTYGSTNTILKGRAVVSNTDLDIYQYLYVDAAPTLWSTVSRTIVRIFPILQAGEADASQIEMFP